jgi:hypothetical protein
MKKSAKTVTMDSPTQTGKKFTTPLLSTSPVSMDGPKVPWTVADLFYRPPLLALTYHVSSAGYDFFTPVGAVVGGVTSVFRSGSTIQYVANGGLIGGATGITLGLVGMFAASKNPNAKLPFDGDGLQTRAQGLKHNYKVRTMDLSAWTGLAIAGGYMAFAGKPTLLAGGTFGVLQALSLGSAAGSLAGITYITITEKRIKAALDADDD